MKQENQSLINENETLKMKIDELNEQVCERESTVGKLSSELHQLETNCQVVSGISKHESEFPVDETRSFISF